MRAGLGLAGREGGFGLFEEPQAESGTAAASGAPPLSLEEMKVQLGLAAREADSAPGVQRAAPAGLEGFRDGGAVLEIGSAESAPAAAVSPPSLHEMKEALGLAAREIGSSPARGPEVERAAPQPATAATPRSDLPRAQEEGGPPREPAPEGGAAPAETRRVSATQADAEPSVRPARAVAEPRISAFRPASRREIPARQKAEPGRAQPPSVEEAPAEGRRLPREEGERSLPEKKEKLRILSEELDEIMAPALTERMKNPSWYLTGVTVGLESLRVFYEISDLVYREYTAFSQGGRRLANIKQAYEKLTEFAEADQTIKNRVAIMLNIRLPLETLLREARGEEEGSDEEDQARTTVVGQLAADINLNLKRTRSFEEVELVLRELLRPRYIIWRRARRKLASDIYAEYAVYRKYFGFSELKVLLKRASLRETVKRVRGEIDQLVNQITVIHGKIYSGRYQPQASSDLRADLHEEKIRPILQDVFGAGFEYLHRAYTAYEHSLELVGCDNSLFLRVAELGAEVVEEETKAARRRAAG